MLYLLTDELFCIAINITLLLGVYTQKGNFSDHEESTRRFTWIIYADTVFIVAAILSELLEGRADLTVLSYMINTAEFLSVDLMLLAFTAYIASLIKVKKGTAGKLINVVACTVFVRIALVIIMTVTGNLFTIENGEYIDQGKTFIVYILVLIVMLELVAVVITHKDCFTTREFIVMHIYILLPIVPVIVEMYTEWYSLTVIASTLSVLIVYILVQAVTIESGKARENLLEEVSYTDFLTRLPNRRAYYRSTAELDAGTEVGVLFCDLNGLKYTNDNFGHAEGDKLIVRFAGILTHLFEKDTVYRVSGDEFVVLFPGCTQDTFAKKYNRLRAVIEDNNTIASVGDAYGKADNIEQLVSKAEAEMYEDKRRHNITRI